ncbi:hypothetical protein SSTG_04238 [Streptomyces sp. e14]|uniref:hypothetical protein n=1 Tax=Streptomyces sp. e14 TaxID=645465 RepID=UPI0001D06251|nr:hypothetical protein [Streptomyces sp. e14]EFF93919.1 hypothetical protein SSTG_04238 [Streptomyces sp. e14]
MTDRTAENGERPPGAKMTIQVYTVRGDGTRTEPRAVAVVPYDGKLGPLNFVNPPCACPIHRAAEPQTGEAQPESAE